MHTSSTSLTAHRVARRRLLLAGLGGSLAACVPVPYGSYYRPGTTDGVPHRLRGELCQGATGPETRIELDAALRLSASAHRGDSDRNRPQWPLRIGIVLPPGRSLQFESDRPDIVELGSGRPIAAAVAVVARRLVTIAADAPVDLARLRPVATANPAGASVGIGLPALGSFAPAALLLRGPTVRIGDASHAFPAVRMSLPVGSEVQSIARYHTEQRRQQLQTRLEACRRDTPQRACDNIPKYDDTSFEVDAGPVTWRGGFLRHLDSRKAATLRGSLRLDLRGADRWRLVDPVVELQDAAGGPPQQLPLARLQIGFDERIALSTPLHPSAEERGDTDIDLELALPDGPPDFEVRLPAALLDGRRTSFPPLRFERRRFDGGLLPFNC